MTDTVAHVAELDDLARAIWRLLETHSDPKAERLSFDARDWQRLLIEEERNEYREIAAIARRIATDTIGKALR